MTDEKLKKKNRRAVIARLAGYFMRYKFTVILAFTVGPAVSWIGRMISGKKPCHR